MRTGLKNRMMLAYLQALSLLALELHAADKAATTPESEIAKKIIAAQQQNQKAMQKTVEEIHQAVPALESTRKRSEAELPAATPPRKIAPPPPAAPGAIKDLSQARDPFTTSETMYREMGQQSVSGAGRGFVPALGMDNVPKMKLKGIFSSNRKQPATALLEVEGAGVFLVRNGDEIGLQAIGRNQVLKVIKVDALKVEVQAGQINQVIIVR